ncbi:MAG: SAM-dependent methyltransferase [Anaerolineaceae bacterium]|nr:SAM-dependent methyltransferase [Anaerolineaceae bacterium]
MYSTEPEDKKQFRQEFDRFYGRFAKLYDWTVKIFPVWRNWISQAIPHIVGPKVLEVSFGTGYLLTQYANNFETCGIDYNWELTCIAKRNLEANHVQAAIQQADIEHLPYRAETFNTVVNTMAFSGCPNGRRAMAEIYRVLQGNGRFVLIDINYPENRNWVGMKLARFWASTGDIIRDMGQLFSQAKFHYVEKEVGGFGTVHLYVATKIG